MKTLRVRQTSGGVQEIILHGDRRDPEPTYLRIRFPGGEVELVRTSEAGYWAHVYVNTPDHEGWDPAATMGRMTDARLDILDKHTSQADRGDFANPGLYHLAVRVDRAPAKEGGDA